MMPLGVWSALGSHQHPKASAPGTRWRITCSAYHLFPRFVSLSKPHSCLCHRRPYHQQVVTFSRNEPLSRHLDASITTTTACMPSRLTLRRRCTLVLKSSSRTRNGLRRKLPFWRSSIGTTRTCTNDSAVIRQQATALGYLTHMWLTLSRGPPGGFALEIPSTGDAGLTELYPAERPALQNPHRLSHPRPFEWLRTSCVSGEVRRRPTPPSRPCRVCDGPGNRCPFGCPQRGGNQFTPPCCWSSDGWGQGNHSRTSRTCTTSRCRAI